MSSGKRKSLTLQQKIDVIRQSESGKSSRNLADIFGVGRTQIQCIVKNKEEFKKDFAGNAPASKKRNIRKTGYEELNELVWEWFKDGRARALPINGPLIQERAKSFAKDLGKPDFKASNGWLESFRKRHNISGGTICGESADVDSNIMQDWADRLPELMSGYEARDIYNLDESGFFFRSSANKTLRMKGGECKGDKTSKERLTVMLCANAVGSKERALVIGKSKKPRCFKNTNMSMLPVTYYHSSKAWMTSAIMEDYLTKLDQKMGRQNRKILLFMDNAASHPHHVTLKNIKICFLPANISSKSQPMDQGIIQALKLKYRKKQLRRIIQKMAIDRAKAGSDFLKEINVADAIYWCAEAWEDVDPKTIIKCFRRCNMVPGKEIATEEMETVADTETPGTDTAMDADVNGELNKTAVTLFGCGIQDVVDSEKDIATCETETTNSEMPAQELLQSFSGENYLDDSCDDELVIEEKPNSCITLDTAASYANQLAAFALEHGFTDILGHVSKAEDAIAKLFVAKIQAARQINITDYFSPL